MACVCARVELASLGSRFSNNVVDASAAWDVTVSDPQDVQGIPTAVLRLAAQSANAAGASRSRAALHTHARACARVGSRRVVSMRCLTRRVVWCSGGPGVPQVPRAPPRSRDHGASRWTSLAMSLSCSTARTRSCGSLRTGEGACRTAPARRGAHALPGGRRTLDRAYVSRASAGSKWDNEPLIGDILRLRQEMSSLLG